MSSSPSDGTPGAWKDYPKYDPGFGNGAGIDPGYERRVGIDQLGKANEITYYLTNSPNAKTVAGPDQQRCAGRRCASA